MGNENDAFSCFQNKHRKEEMKLITKRLILRDVLMKDAKDVAENANDKEIGNFTTVPYPYTIKNAREFIKKKELDKKKKPRETYAFGITIKDNNIVIGIISLDDINKSNKKAEIGYWLGRKYRQQGIISEAEKAILDFGFKKLKLNKIYGKAMPKNTGSNKLYDILRTLKCAVSMMHVLISDVVLNCFQLHKPDAGCKFSSAPQMFFWISQSRFFMMLKK